MTKACWILAAVAWCALAATAQAQAQATPPAASPPASPSQPAAPTAAPEPPATRWISFALGPQVDYFFARDSRTILGPVVYGGALQLEYRPIPWLGVSANVAYLVGQNKSRAELGYANFRRNADVTMTPINLGVQANILPGSRANPYVAATVGALYFSTRIAPEAVRSPVPLTNDDLAVNVHQWLPAYGGEVGVDVRVNSWFGVFATGFFRYAGIARAPYAIPGASETLRLPLTTMGATIGLIVYY